MPLSWAARRGCPPHRVSSFIINATMYFAGLPVHWNRNTVSITSLTGFMTASTHGASIGPLLLRVAKYIYECETGGTYKDLAELLRGKNYYIATTNQDAQFFRVFPAERITRIQGDWRYWQCKRPCHDEIYYNKEQVFRLCEAIEDDALPDELIPRCPHCGGVMDAWVRSHTFLQGEYYEKEMQRYMDFLRRNANRKTLFLELGVGLMTPMFIKEPFMNMVYQWPHAFYATLNPQHALVPKEIAKKSLAISDDIAITLKQLLGKSTAGMKEFNVKEAFNPARVY